MDYSFSGIITQVFPAQQGVSARTGNPWMSQEYLLEYEHGNYPRSICFRVYGQERIQNFAIMQGEQLTVHLNFSAQASKDGRYFNTVEAWKVKRGGVSQMQSAPMPGAPMPGASPAAPQAPMPGSYQPGYAPQQMPGGYQQPAPGYGAAMPGYAPQQGFAQQPAPLPPVQENAPF